MNERGENGALAGFFRGEVHDQALMPFPELTRDEDARVEELVRATATALGGALDSARIDRAGELPEETVPVLAREGVLRATLPADLGGLGLGVPASVELSRALARLDPSLALLAGTHASVGVEGPVHFAREPHRERLVRDLVAGTGIGAVAISEPGAGNDLSALTTRATLSPDGEGYVLDGHKIWVVGAPAAELFTVVARTSPATASDPELVVLCVRRADGVEVGAPVRTLGARGAPVASLSFSGVKVPSGRVLGAVGEGHEVTLRLLARARLDVAARCLGQAEHVLALSCRRSEERAVFGRPLAGFEIVRSRMGRITARVYAAAAMARLCARDLERGEPSAALEAAAVKVYASEALGEAAANLSRLAGGLGQVEGYAYERALRDAQLPAALFGANDALCSWIALSSLRPPPGAATVAPRWLSVLGGQALRRARGALKGRPGALVHPLVEGPFRTLLRATDTLGRAAERWHEERGSAAAESQTGLLLLSRVGLALFALGAGVARASGALERGGPDGARVDLHLVRGLEALAREAETRLQDLGRREDEDAFDAAGRAAHQWLGRRQLP